MTFFPQVLPDRLLATATLTVYHRNGSLHGLFHGALGAASHPTMYPESLGAAALHVVSRWLPRGNRGAVDEQFAFQELVNLE